MKTDDIFEAITDIDDKLIEKAFPIMDDPSAPVTVFPAERKPRRRIIATAAACAACAVCVTALGVVGVNYLRGKGIIATSTPAASTTSDYRYWYPEVAKYIVSEKITNNTAKLSWGYATSGEHFGRWDDESYFAKDYDELAAKSDLIVAGQFVDLPHQAQDPEETHLCEHIGIKTTPDGEVIDLGAEGPLTDACMFNYLQVERVIKGSANVGDDPFRGTVKENVKAGDMLLINQETSIHIGAQDNVYLVFAEDRLTPMLKGDKWIYFLQKTEDGYYIPVNGAQGRYPLPNNKNVDLSAGGVEGIDEFSTYPNAAPARQEIYDRLKKLLSDSGQNVQKIDVPKEEKIEYEFLMEEFPEYTFKVRNYNVIVNIDPPTGLAISCTSFSAINAWRIDELYLADLNADGKREICATISVGNSGVTAVRVCDLENGVDYILASDSAENVYALAEDSDRLMAVTKENLPLYYNRLPEELSRVPLTLDMMKEINTDLEEVPVSGFDENGERALYVPEFTSTWFVMTKKEIIVRYKDHDDTPISGDEIQKLFLYDINGDDRREICAQVLVDGKVGIRVYDFMEQATYSLFGDKDQSEHRYELGGNTGGALFVVSRSIGTTGDPEQHTTSSTSTELNMSMLTKDGAPAAKKVFDWFKSNDMPWGETWEFEVPEFPDVKFAWQDGVVSAELNGKVTELYCGMPVYDVYLADLNDDGIREICSTVSIGSGIIDERVFAYDYANGKLYMLENRGVYNYRLELRNGEGGGFLVCLVTGAYDGAYNSSEEIIDIIPLSLDKMKDALL